MNQGLVDRWNARVKPEDEVWVLGDIALGDYHEARKWVEQLNGKKYLCKGNHDSNKILSEIGDLFEEVVDYKELWLDKTHLVLSHYPIHNWNRQQYGSIHLYGHVHSNPEYQLPFDNSYNVGVDVNDFEPKTLEELIGEHIT